MSRQGRHLKAGEYRFDRAMTPFEIIDKIARGDVFVISVTFPEGLTIAEMAKIFESHGLGPAAAFVRAAKDASPIRELDPAAKDLEGYLFPETYAVPRRTDAAKLTRLMIARFEKVLTPELRQAAAARNLTVRQAVTLASIVEKETAKADERPLVAAVYATRLRIGMPLQCDPTVIYGLVKAGRYDGNIHKDDLSFDSPYNTYRYPGLPPGPIASPGRASLEAAVHPADADYPVLRQPQRRLARIRANARGAQPECPEVSGSVLPRSSSASLASRSFTRSQLARSPSPSTICRSPACCRGASRRAVSSPRSC